MKQWVNLYRNELKPVKQRLTLTKVSSVLGLWLGLLLVVVGVTQWQKATIVQKNEQLSATLESLNSDLANNRERISLRQPSPQLQAEKEQLQQELQDARSFSQQIAEFRQNQSSSVSEFLHELAEITPEDIWLTDFSMSGENIRLHGQALNSEALVLWMDKFGQSGVLSDKRFAVVELKRSEQGYQQFLLQSVRSSEGESNNE
ncbi:PilN domain-containing protein [Idiomarina loihiensis]|jgi:Tfp pilus assembly protein PilN|uniref:Type II secretory pathway component n=1 Tax=Idiomarina loihiensis (strain ATCC BAA-735 / DSM 15497 / L2-TR) TaxID=283942 RepID=Q5QWC4_IDILO|nr:MULTISPECIES: PilN domain-containing protein [Idiomarina]AAV81207.1 Type II secretory pathway component [Idiomarina loihiensis L2TR]AGM35232.1 Type II secretory pathway component [Idiomarina loihiensis GSL 199]MRJ45341.1 Type II secretory pathway component [Idiomarina loihiensis]PHQ93054.1 MAG: Type II secretory pathway component [Idiomarina sp.]UTW32302.1 PilN domain-containing protein [Idiomarina loihiensis]